MRRRASALAAFAACFLVATVAFSQTKASPEARRAKALFEEGVALSDEGKWAEALAAFKKSDELVSSASARYNIAATLRAMGHYVEAKAELERIFADTSSKALKPALKKDVDKLLAEVKAKIVSLTLAVSPAHANVEMDGSPIQLGPTGEIAVDPGKHVFVVSAEGHDTATITHTVEPGVREIALVAPKTIAKIQVVEAKPFYTRAWFIVTLSVVATAGAATGIILGTRPRETPPASPPQATVDHVIPAGWRF
jgi:tetratricopeptide (TPR) repeat protein